MSAVRPGAQAAGRTDTGPLPLVLLHALPLDASMWDETARRLRARDHHVIALDQRGFGTMPLPDEPPSLDLVADDLARELDRRGIDSVALAGCSMGGYVALSFLRRHPGRVRALALLAARATADTPQAAGARLRFADLILDDSLRDRVVAETTPSLLGATTRAGRRRLLAEVTDVARAARPHSIAWAQRAIAARADATAVLHATDVPAVVVIGEEDELVTLAEARETSAALPRGRLVTLPEVGHLAPLEAPETTVEILTDLLTRAEKAGSAGVPAEGASAC
ncbi:alpha/beta hydrolase [Streptomyces sp. NPDC001137]|uniref:alpha/beta fold hydrolase n=1 Tax=Streptomyces sp. NPDC001137 TaxID=3154378 RepID=UPI0033301DA3